MRKFFQFSFRICKVKNEKLKMPLITGTTTDATVFNRNNYYKNAPTLKSLGRTPYFPGFNSYEYHPSKALAHFYQNLLHMKPSATTVATTSKYKVIHKHKDKESSWMDYLNPFDCDTEYEDRDIDDGDEDEYYDDK